MSYKLVIAEKPSVARDIARVIGANKKGDGYIEGNGYRVTWAVGHLVGLAEPEEYGFVSQGDMWKGKKEEAYAELPIIPDAFKLIVLENTKEQFRIVKSLMNSDECEYIIDAGDLGAEGHILQWFIREKAGCKKEVKRFCATSMTDEAIRYAMEHLRDVEEFANIIRGEYCKKRADWIMGMSVSRCASIKYNANISVGRVQSPTLFFIVKRFLDVRNFKISNYYTLRGDMQGGFSVFWNKDKHGAFLSTVKDSEGRVIDRDSAVLMAEKIKAKGKGVVSEIKAEKKSVNRPQLYDITELQRDANRIYGYTASQTLATAQCLYESYKVLSYPRTDSRYITSDLKNYMLERVGMIKKIKNYNSKADGVVGRLLKVGLNIDKRIVNDEEVTDHHALIPTENISKLDMSTLVPISDKEKKSGVTHETLVNVFSLVLNQFLLAFCQPYLYEQTTLSVDFGDGMIMGASGSTVIDGGWKEVYKELKTTDEEEQGGEEEEKQSFPTLKRGDVVVVRDVLVVDKKTTPPKYHTEATLLTAMENAGNYIQDGAILKGKGIGTQATRAEIINTLFERNFCVREKKGKTTYILPTTKGIQTIQILPKELYSPQITADWEMKISRIASGKMTEKEFMEEFEEFIKKKVAEVKNSNSNIVFKSERPSYGDCPWCDTEVVRFDDKEKGRVRYYCPNKACAFSVSTDNEIVKKWTGKCLTETQILKLINSGEVILKNISQTGGEDIDAYWVIEKKEVDGKVYCNVVCDRKRKPAPKKKSVKK